MKYLNQSIGKYLKDLSARTPAPGGGSVAALSGAAAASLLVMACSFTIGKDKYKKYEARLKKISNEAAKIRKRFMSLVDEDVKAYGSGDMKEAIRVPSEVCLLSHALLKLAQETIGKCSKMLISDVALAFMLSEASFSGGYLYVLANVYRVKDGAQKYRVLLARLNQLKQKISLMGNETEVEIGHSSGR